MTQCVKEYVVKKQAKLQRQSRRMLGVDTRGDRVFIYCAGNGSEWTETKRGLGGENYNNKHKDHDGAPIIYRHLAFAWLLHHKRRDTDTSHGYHGIFGDVEQVKQIPILISNVFDKKHIQYRANQPKDLKAAEILWQIKQAHPGLVDGFLEQDSVKQQSVDRPLYRNR